MILFYWKKSLWFIIVLFIFLLILAYQIINPVFTYQNKPNNLFIDRNNLFADVQTLTSIDPSRNYFNIDSLNKAADYIFSEFEKTGCELDVQRFIVDKGEYKNVICSFGIKNSERLVVGAHYDVFSNTSGADDNASGVTGLLELARVIAREHPELKYRLDLVAYTLEEPPFFRTSSMGSAKHAQYLKENNIKIRGVIILEMIGFFSDEKDSQNYPTPLLKIFYPNEGSFIAVVGRLEQKGIVRKIKRNIRENSNIEVRSINAPTFISGIDFSDHLNYWNQGYDAVMITDTSSYRSPHYHLESDTIEKLDFDKMSEIIKGVYFSVINF